MRSFQWGTARYVLGEMTEHDVRIYLWSFRAGSKTYVCPLMDINYLFSRVFFPLYIRFIYAARHSLYLCNVHGCMLSASCDSVRYGYLID